MRHNILLITADDMAGSTPGCTGNPSEATPAIDRLAGQGTLFGRAHVPVAVCQPSRSAMMTGRWPHLSGAEGFEPVSDGVPLLTDVLREAGYRCGILGKVEHLQPVSRFGWDLARSRDELGAGRDPGIYAAEAGRFIAGAAGEGRPWFLMANAHDPHRPFHGSDDEQRMFSSEQLARIPPPSRVFTPGEVTVPGFLPDLPDVRREIAEYQSSARRCDDVVAALLDVLARSGQEERTLVVFLSDNGMAFPFAKANCYLQSTLTPLVVRWPGVTVLGRHDRRHFVSGLDLFPTFCDAAGVSCPDDVNGRTLLPLLQGQPEGGRDHVVTVFHETAAKGRYEMRAVQTAERGYIWNYWSDGWRAYQAENMTGRSWAAMVDAAARDQRVAARNEFYLHRAPEELYDLTIDPAGLDNLAGSLARQPDLATMRTLLLQHLRSAHDPLAAAFQAHLDGPAAALRG
jgi:N-sulfoglucosamine sulfohydrolase